MRFELTDPFGSLVFKTSAIDHSTTLPYRNTPSSQTPTVSRTNLFQVLMCFYMAGTIGIEPILIESKSIVLPLHNAPTKAFKFLKNIFFGKNQNKKPESF